MADGPTIGLLQMETKEMASFAMATKVGPNGRESLLHEACPGVARRLVATTGTMAA